MALADLTRATIETLKKADFPLVMPGAEELIESRKMILTQLQARLLPQFEAQEFPTVVVFGGSSGAGKSTIVNSLVGDELTPASIIRPTTKKPILIAHPQDEVAILRHPLAKTAKVITTPNAIPSIALVDAPDLDTVNEENQEISRRLLESADLWIFTTTALRYGDAKAWQMLELANQRGLTCAVVLNRVPQQAEEVLREDIRQRLITANLANAPLFTIPDFSPMSGLIASEVVAELKNWLSLLAMTKLNEIIAERTTSAVIPTLQKELMLLADGLEGQANALIDLSDKAVEAAAAPLKKITQNVKAGRFGQGAPASSWLALASSGGPLAVMIGTRKKPKLLQRTKQKCRSRETAFQTLFETVETGIEAALMQALIATQTQIEFEWENDVVQTTEFIAQARERLHLSEIVAQALSRWKIALQSLGMNCRSNKWLSADGNAALLGVAAAGVAGVTKLAAELGLEDDMRQARKVLAVSVTQAVDKVVAEYVAALEQVNMPDATALKLRAAEFVNRV